MGEGEGKGRGKVFCENYMLEIIYILKCMKVNIRKKIYIFFSECPISTSQWTYGNVSEVQRLFECQFPQEASATRGLLKRKGRPALRGYHNLSEFFF